MPALDKVTDDNSLIFNKKTKRIDFNLYKKCLNTLLKLFIIFIYNISLRIIYHLY